MMRDYKELDKDAYEFIKKEIELEIEKKEKELEVLYINRTKREMKNALFDLLGEENKVKKFTEEELNEFSTKEREIKKEIKYFKKMMFQLENTIKRSYQI